VQFAAVVSSSWPTEQVRRTVAEAGIAIPVLVDDGDELYGRLGIQVHPDVIVLDDQQRLVAHEPWRKVHFCDRVRGKIQFALHEIDDAEMRRSEDPSAAPARVAARTEPDAVISAPRLFVLSDRFEEGEAR
jgi:hypothetical protein